MLAFLPLDTALPCADALHAHFAKIMDTALDNVGVPAKQKPDLRPTLSVGVAIGHYADHLQTLLKRSDDAEKAAKGFGRNALAVSFAAHSGGGEERTVVHGWGDSPPKNPVATRWWPAMEMHLDDLFSDKGAYELEDLLHECRELVARRPGDAAAVRSVLGSEVARILGRKQAAHGQKRVQETIIDGMAHRLERSADPLDELRRLVNELLIARRIAPVVALDGTKMRDRWPRPVNEPTRDETSGQEAVV